MYVVVISHKKWLNTVLVLAIAFLLLFGISQLAQFLFLQTEITLEQRVSFIFSQATDISSLYMTSPDLPAIQTGSLAGRKWETKTIQQMDLSEIEFQYPETLRMDEILNLGSEVTIHMNFQHTNNKMVGFFQVWKLNLPFKEFMANAKKFSSMTFESFKESDIKVQTFNGVMWEYVFVTRTKEIHALEAFIVNGDEMYRFSMFIVQDDYKPAYKKIFTRMIQSLRVKG